MITNIIGYACLSAAMAFFALAWVDHCWRMGLASIVLAAVGALLLVTPANAQEVHEIEPYCAVLVKFTLHSSGGPIVIEDVCLSAPVIYADGLLTIETREFLGDDIFHGNFEVWP